MIDQFIAGLYKYWFEFLIATLALYGAVDLIFRFVDWVSQNFVIRGVIVNKVRR